jgi:chemotaxis protein CheX
MMLNGVQQRLHAALEVEPGRLEAGARTERGDGGRRMPESLRENLSEIADPRNLDASVAEVFQLMLGTSCRKEEVELERAEEQVTAVVGFGGILSGACVFRSGGEAARRVAARMTGMEFCAVDDTVKDGIGELCNMLAGSWKGKVPELAARCGLSVPAVITGHDYELHVQAPEFRLRHVYAFDGVRFEVTILCDGIQ